MSLTFERLNELLEYNPDTGVFSRLISNRRWKAGEPVGSVAGGGYVILKLDGVKYYAHRLAWLYMTGEWPKQNIDHRDGDKANNRFTNLRDVGQSENLLNLHRPNAGNTSGFLGVSPCGKRWAAFLSGKYLGVRDTPELASQLYLETKQTA